MKTAGLGRFKFRSDGLIIRGTDASFLGKHLCSCPGLPMDFALGLVDSLVDVLDVLLQNFNACLNGCVWTSNPRYVATRMQSSPGVP